jgi:[ribosomal protein S5]-alanine N-acetyltransferase
MLHTDRLDLRPWTPEDTGALFAIQSDSTAMRFTHVATSLEAHAARLQAWEAGRTVNGFAPWVVRERRSLRVIGWGGAGIDPDEPAWGPEAIYVFHSSAWGQGLATELVRFAIATAFASSPVNLMAAFTHPHNIASAKVLAKCGFRFQTYEPSLERNRYLVRSTIDSPVAPKVFDASA